ncbi:MAG: glycosyltransferase family 1 protein [Planctomycetota bacterium]|nr:MAG: glycosyltransferase family 1 protein [Planctomycetota bacterium]
MRLAFDARVRPRSSFARVLALFEEAARAVELPWEEWRGGPCAAEVLWSVRQAEAPLPGAGGGPPRQVVTIYDVNPLLPDGRPAWQRWRRARRFRRRAGAALADAWRVVTSSEDARGRIEAAFPAAAGRCAVVPLYPEARFTPDGPPSTLAEPGYLLFLGALRRHKNAAGLVRAYARLPAALRRAHPLLLAGRAHRARRRLARLLAALGLAGQVRLLDEVPEEELPGLYRGAAAFAFPSLAEGFGLPPLEAMACGTPVVASDRTSLPEVLGGAAELVDPLDPAALAVALERVLADPAQAEARRQAGLARAAAFGPAATGRALRALLEDPSR